MILFWSVAIPDEAGRRGYRLLTQTMERLAVVAIAKITLHRREQTAVIRPYQGGLILHTVYYPDEIQSVVGYGHGNAVSLKKEEISLSEQFTKELLRPFVPQEFHDGYQARIRELLRNKRKGHALPLREKREKPAPVIDLMFALKKSLAAKKLRRSDAHPKFTRARKTA
jgi:DNA end-binding protein Ku